MSVSAVLLFCSFSTNLHFHCWLALICFIFIILVLQYFRRVCSQKFTQNYFTIAATTNKKIGTPFFLFLPYYLIIFPYIVFISNCYSSIMVSYIFCNNNKQHQQKQQQRKCIIDMISMLHFINFILYLCYLSYKPPFPPIFYYCFLLWLHKH